MIEKIINIENIGVLKCGAPKAIDLKRVSLIYADNARGKSTLSSLLLACSEGNVKDVRDRKTVGVASAQKVLMRVNPPFGAAAGAYNVDFDGTKWNGKAPDVHVFNQTFVERNVFASTGVLPEQREALLTLALGDAAVIEKSKFEHQAELQKAGAGKVSAAEGALTGFKGNLSVDQFIALAPVPDIEKALASVDKQISDARASGQIAERPDFRKVALEISDFEKVAEVVGSSFESLAVVAEQKAKEHFARHKGPITEKWVSEGMTQLIEDECPFCGQETGGLELFQAYKAYFDNSYSEYLSKVEEIYWEVSRQFETKISSYWRSSHEFNQGLLGVWAESLGISSIPALDYAKADLIQNSILIKLLGVVRQKQSNPLSALETDAFTYAASEADNIGAMAQAYNGEIEKLNQLAEAYRAKFAKADLTALIAERNRLLMKQKRFEPATVVLIDAVKQARIDYKLAEKAKDAARDALDKLMETTLGKFQKDINDWLVKFAAPFQIDQLAPTYKGGGLRSEYVLKVRGAKVNVGPTPGGELSFHTALSEGDKRTLAFSFFLAQLFVDPNKANVTVVLDDVFTSLDKHRRHNTIEALLKMASECSQVITLAHDAHFLRELKKRVVKKKLGETAELALHRDVEDYSFLDHFDLDDYCSSEYYKHYVAVERFVNAEPSQLLEVAKSLRPLVEGHLHRCFPKKFKEGQTVGEMLDQIKSAKSPSPLVRLQSLHGDLQSFNDFAAAFHHDTSGGYVRVEVNEAELLPFAIGALGFIQIRSFS